jgi:hypothetical protein
MQRGALSTEPSNAGTATIGPDGGTVSATAADGTTYALEVPAWAVAQPVEITMTPVSAIEGLPLSGGLAGAVELEPSGTVLARSATLRITTTKGPEADQILAGFSASNDLSTRALSRTAASDATISVLVSHFSAAGVGFGTTQDIAQLTTGTSTSLDTYMSDVLAFPTPWDNTHRQIGVEIAEKAFAEIVLPELAGAADDFDLLIAVADYDQWRSLLDVILNEGEPVPWEPGEHFDAPQYADLRNQAANAAEPRLLEAVIRNAQTCGEESSVQAMANALFWQGHASAFAIDLPGSDLDLPNVLEAIRTHCATVELIGSDLPAELPLGDPVDVEIAIGVRFVSGEMTFTPAGVTLTSADATIQGTNTTTDGGGVFHTTIVATTAGPVTIHGHACIVLPVTFVISPVCGDFDLNSGDNPSPSAEPGGAEMAGEWQMFLWRMPTGGTCTGFFQGSTGTATFPQSGSSFEGTWQTADGCGMGLQMSGTLSGTLTVVDGQFFQLDDVTFVISTSSISGCYGPATYVVPGPSPLAKNTAAGTQTTTIAIGDVTCNGVTTDGSIQLDRQLP